MLNAYSTLDDEIKKLDNLLRHNLEHTLTKIYNLIKEKEPVLDILHNIVNIYRRNATKNLKRLGKIFGENNENDLYKLSITIRNILNNIYSTLNLVKNEETARNLIQYYNLILKYGSENISKLDIYKLEELTRYIRNIAKYSKSDKIIEKVLQAITNSLYNNIDIDKIEKFVRSIYIYSFSKGKSIGKIDIEKEEELLNYIEKYSSLGT
ncbi:MAG: hypothetical protein ACP5G1_02605 [Nanopusillaceae archaeon]